MKLNSVPMNSGRIPSRWTTGLGRACCIGLAIVAGLNFCRGAAPGMLSRELQTAKRTRRQKPGNGTQRV